MPWTWLVSVIAATALGVNLGVILMAMIVARKPN